MVAAPRSVRHFWTTAGEYVTHWAVAGAVLALTGFAPDHWFATVFHQVEIPDALRRWPLVDYRLLAVCLGVAIVAADVLLRNRRRAAALLKKELGENGRPRTDLAQTSAAAPQIGPRLPDKPSIAVLPFANLGGDASQEYFSDGITEDIITELSRFSELFVIARNSSFQYKGKPLDLRQVGRDLGVSNILEGSIRRDGARVRITAQLVDAGTGAHRWAERYDRELNDVFAIQDEVARTIAAILAAHLNKAEAERTLLKPPATWQAYDHYMRAADAWTRFLGTWKLQDFWEARGSLEKSLSIDPEYARAYAMLASTYRVAFLNPVDADHLQPATLDRAIQLARKAIELDPNLPEACAELAYTIVRKGEHDAAVAAAERAISLNPNFADYRVAAVFVFVGEPAKAVEIVKAHMRLIHSTHILRRNGLVSRITL